MAEQLKILVSGDVEGGFKKLFSRVVSINKKSGPFDYAICVGNFFGENDEELLAYKKGKSSIPIPTYILGPNDNESLKFYPEFDSCEIVPNLFYLGKRGIFTTNNGLIIAYVSGVEDENLDPACQITVEDMECVQNACIKGQTQSFRGIDILLSSSWPAGVSKYDENAVPDVPIGSKIISKLAYAVKPRYHFFGLNRTHYERKPYKNIHSHIGCHYTRAMALANVGNERKEKWLYAMNIVPMKFMKESALSMMTTDTTDCPYEFEQNDHRQQFFYDMNYYKEDNGGRNKPRRKRHHSSGERNDGSKVMNITQDDCWFCLGSPKFQKHLVISVGEEAYLTLPKGGLVWDHVMICPISHYKNFIDMPSSLQDEINAFKDGLTKYYSSQKKIPVFFNRNFLTPHYQIQVTPIPNKSVEHARQLFLIMAEQKQFSLTEIPDNAAFEDILGIQGDHFYVEIGKYRFIHVIRSRFPLQFAREVLARREILDVEDRVDWRKVDMTEEEETENAKKFRKAYRQFDFTIE